MRAAQKIIHTDSLQHNLNVLADLAPQSQCIAVLKANAYGCEATRIVSALERADMFAVAALDEALALRDAGADKPIVLLEGVFEEREIALAKQHNCEIVVATVEQLQWLLDSEHTFTRVWFKLDTGMGRLGFTLDCAHEAFSRLASRYNHENIVIMTHFADADNPNRSYTLQQIACFDEFAKHYPDCKQSLCGSAGILAYPDAHRDFIRPGVALYGASPFDGNWGEDHDLQPVMTLATKVLSVKKLNAGEPVGYGLTYHMKHDGYVAICQIGYADGYSRFIPSDTPVLINGCEYHTVGRVAMDMLAVLVDETVMPQDSVICWGQGLPIERVCQHAGTIPHQLLTTVTERPHKVIE